MSSAKGATCEYEFKVNIPPGFSLDEAQQILKPFNDGAPFDNRYFRVLRIDQKRVATIQSEPDNEAYLVSSLPGYLESEARKLDR